MNVHDFKTETILGQEKPLRDFAGKALLIVNVASKCGLTPQYKGLESLYKKYKDKGFEIIGMPCNQFAGQEPGTEAEIQQFCSMNYDVTFPLTKKIEVNGAGKHPLYAYLTGKEAGFPGDITWNFEKFLVGKDGTVLKRFSPRVVPEDPEIVKAIESAIA